MSLLDDIQEAAVDASVDISVLLRRCKVLAARLGNEDFRKWVEYELNGYPNKEELPAYRIIKVQSYGDFIGVAWSGYKNAPIPLGCIQRDLRDFVATHHMSEPISYFASLVGEKPVTAPLRSNWSADLIARVGGDIFDGMRCMSAWQLIPIGLIVALLNTVRNRILSFVLELQAEAPDVGEGSPNSRPIANERVGQVFQTYILGDVTHFTAGGDQTVTYSTKITVIQNDLQSLKQFLLSLGLTDEDCGELEESIREDSKTGPQGRISDGVRAWLGKMISKAGSGAWTIATSVAADLLTKALSKYYGYQI